MIKASFDLTGKLELGKPGRDVVGWTRRLS
jgi:hypothetical protein